ncbi:unnamed protein product, partial [Thlaspi arvense]
DQVYTPITFSCYYDGKFGRVESNAYQFDEEASDKMNVADFIDEEIDKYATPLCSDVEEDDNVTERYFRYKKGNGELKLRQAFDNLEDIKQVILAYVVKKRWNVKYVRWENDKSELRCSKQKKIGNCKVFPAGNEIYKVRERKSAFKVCMLIHTCTWKMPRLSCCHYSKPIEVVRCINFWEKSDEVEIMPPSTEIEPTKRRKKIPIRIKIMNVSPSKKMTRFLLMISGERRTIHFGRCGNSRHNTRKCQNVVLAIHRPPKMKKVSEDRSDFGEGSSQPTQSQLDIDVFWIQRFIS